MLRFQYQNLPGRQRYGHGGPPVDADRLQSCVRERINNLRVKQAHDAGADTIVTGCAYCMHMLQDSVKLLNYDESMRVIDVASLVAESLAKK